MLYFSLIIYTFLALSLFGLGTKSARIGSISHCMNNKSTQALDIYCWCSIALFTVIAGLRYNVGSDCEDYAAMINDVSRGIYDTGHGSRDVELLVIYLYKIIIALGSSRVLLLGAFAFCEAYFLWSALNERRHLLPFMSAILILGPYWLPFNNGLRQVVVSCVFLYATQQLIDHNKWKKYLALMFVSYFIHRSCLILFPGIFLMFYKYLPNRFLMLGALGLAVFLNITEFIKPFLELSETYIAMLGYSDYSDVLSVYIDQDGIASNYGPRRIVILITYVLVMFYSKEIDKSVNGNQYYRVCILLFLIYAILSELLLSSSFIFTRPLTYLKPFVLVTEAYLLWHFKKTKKYVLLLLALFATCTYTYMDNLAVCNDPEEMSLYKFIFFKELY